MPCLPAFQQAGQEPVLGSDAEAGVKDDVLPQQYSSSQPRSQVLVLEIQDRFGCLFLDFKGSPRLCFLFGGLKQLTWALRGVLLGVFIGRRLPHAPSRHAVASIVSQIGGCI